MRTYILSLCIMVLCISCLTSLCIAENERGSDGVRDAIKNRVKDEMLDIAFPSETTFVLGKNKEKDEQILAEQIEVITGDGRRHYRVVPGDDIVISFNDRDERNTAIYRVNESGFIFMPLIGRIKVADMKAYEIEPLLNEELSKFIRDPEVSIQVNVVGKIMVVGAVVRPGVYNFNSDMTVLEAILTAGSYDKDEAELRSVLLMRGTVDKPEVVRLDLKKMIKHGNRRDNIPVKPGDLIYVPTSFINNLDKFFERMYRYVVVWYGLGGQDIIEEGQPFIDAINE
ncbi:MAG: polysaccharide export protein [Candidatus Omnitrophica bacterium]|nr:polysaccharide export protein [Candidatus Omnitrophota bacterium]